MAKFRVSVEVEYDDKLKGTTDYVLGRMEEKINKVLREYSNEHFSKSFVMSPAVIKEIETEKKNAKTIR